MSAREEYTPDDEDVEETYVAYEERFSAEEDPRGNYRRWLAAHDQEVREQIDHYLERVETLLLHVEDFDKHQESIRGQINGIRRARRIARGEEQTDE